MHANVLWPIGSMYGIYANIRGILMVNVTIYYIAYMDPMGDDTDDTAISFIGYEWNAGIRLHVISLLHLSIIR